MTKYIYESPDGGKTVYRREFEKYDKKELIKDGAKGNKQTDTNL